MRFKIKRTKSETPGTKGFTIIELMIASTVFSFMLLLFLLGFIQISQMFYKGVNLSNTQEASRQIVSSIADDIQFSHSDPNLHLNLSPQVNGADGFFCIGSHRYKYNLYNQIGGTNPSAWNLYNNFALVRQNVANCLAPPADTAGDNAQNTQANSELEMLSNGMQLNKLNIHCGFGECTIDLRVVFYGGDKHVFWAPPGPGVNNDVNSPGYNAYRQPEAECTGDIGNSQFCATAKISTTVLQK